MTVEPGNGIAGTLRSELDEGDDVLHNNFNTLAALVGEIRGAFLAYRINPEQAGKMCKDLQIVGSDGCEWTVGATSGGWFKRRVGACNWTEAAMPINVGVVGKEPDWVSKGVTDWILQAESANKLITTTEPDNVEPELTADITANTAADIPQNIRIIVDVLKVDPKKKVGASERFGKH